ncbi:MAG: iron-containing alcohol dehydrogenase [Bacteroidetes bacterium]|nr:MAG: iron-containing alcohol dehydrogenase [Bacteroidota bacterium]
MENFVMYNPVKLHFGDGVTDKIGKVTSDYGKKVLIVTGQGSAKASGAWDKVMERLKEAGLEVTEFSGIKSNPIIEDVDKAAALAKEIKAEVIVALGGGSVIDSAKIIALAAKYDGPAWDIMEEKHKPTDALPLIAVLTLAATGTEMNPYAVVQNNCQQVKKGYGNKLIYPKHSFLDPSFTLTVSRDYTAYGIVDLIAHSLEAWFGQGDASLTDRFTSAIIREAMKYGPELLDDLTNYDLRARIMFAATCALNGMTVFGKKHQDWGVHAIGHCLSVTYDVPHGASLSIAYPAWFKLQKDRIPKRIQELGTALFETHSVDDIIHKMEYVFKGLGSPVTLKEVGIDISDEQVRAKLKKVMIKNKVSGLVYELDEKDYDKLLEYMA